MTTIRARPIQAGWPEILVGLLGLAIVGIAGSAWIVSSSIDPMVIGLILTGMAGIGGLAGFFAAYSLRIRDWAAFGIRSTSRRWLAFAVAVGVLAFVAKSISILVFIRLTGVDTDVQQIYGIGASGGLWAAVLATLLLSVLTPIGEEFLFRGVVTTALMRYGPIIAVGGGALIFALFHGINTAFPAALVTGIIVGEIFRRSGSIWPAVVVHGVVNLPTIPALVLAQAQA
jgi:membrane protease YdiL (CAAX protease family)